MAQAVSARLCSQNGTPWYLGVSTTGVMSLASARPRGEVFFEGQAMYWFLVTSPDGTPWYVAPNPLGSALLTSITPPGPGPGSANQPALRDATGGLWVFLVSNTGVLSVTEDMETALPPALADQDLFYCFKHGLAYRPDTRIYPLSTTHCPIDNSPLVSWRDFVSGSEGDMDVPAEYLEEWLST